MALRRSKQNFVSSIKTTSSAYDEVNFGNDSSLVLTGDFSIAVWLKGYNLWQTSNTHGIFGKRTDSNNREFTCFYQGSTNQIIFGVSTTGGSATVPLTSPGNELLDNKWYRLVVTRSSDDFTMYLNGSIIQTGTSSTVIGDTSANVTLGAWAADGGFNWDGLLTHFHINKGYAWSAAEAQADWKDGVQPTSGSINLDARMTDNFGSTVTDSSASSNNGTLQGSAAWSRGVPMKRTKSVQNFQNSLSLVRGSSQAVTFGNIMNFTETDSFTFAAWVKIRDTTVTNSIWDNFTGGGGIRLLATNANTFWFELRQADSTVRRTIGTTRYRINEWYQVVGVFDTNNIKIYVNGHIDSYVPWVGTDIGVTGTSLYNGYAPNNAWYADMFQSNSQVWSKALSDDEIADLYYDGIIPSDSLEINIDYSDGSGTTLTDQSGNGYNGTITAGTEWTSVLPSKPRNNI